jgi:hypothetical protein
MGSNFIAVTLDSRAVPNPSANERQVWHLRRRDWQESHESECGRGGCIRLSLRQLRIHSLNGLKNDSGVKRAATRWATCTNF